MSKLSSLRLAPSAAVDAATVIAVADELTAELAGLRGLVEALVNRVDNADEQWKASRTKWRHLKRQLARLRKFN